MYIDVGMRNLGFVRSDFPTRGEEILFLFLPPSTSAKCRKNLEVRRNKKKDPILGRVAAAGNKKIPSSLSQQQVNLGQIFKRKISVAVTCIYLSNKDLL